MPYRRVVKNVLAKVMEKGASGIKIQILRKVEWCRYCEK